jgi:hypothetical protein
MRTRTSLVTDARVKLHLLVGCQTVYILRIHDRSSRVASLLLNLDRRLLAGDKSFKRVPRRVASTCARHVVWLALACFSVVG